MKKFASIFLALIILISSTGITFSTHFCMGHAVISKLMIGKSDLSCGMNEMESACGGKENTSTLLAAGCCATEYLAIQVDDNYQNVSSTFSFEHQFLFAVTYTFLLSQASGENQVLAYSDHIPPPLEQDFQSMYQLYLL